MNHGGEPKQFADLGNDRRRLGTKLGDGAIAFDLGSGSRQGTLGRIGALGHVAPRGRGVRSLQADRGPDHGVELEQEKQSQYHAHDELYLRGDPMATRPEPDSH